MNAVTPITITTPDGVERQLRFTLGARKRIYDAFGGDLKTVLNERGDAALPDILYSLMFDAKGKPPDLDLEELRESLPVDAGNEILAAIMSAATQGKTPKNELEEQLNRVTESERMKLSQTTNGFVSGLHVVSSSESQTKNSGGDISNVKSLPDLRDGESTSELSNTVTE